MTPERRERAVAALAALFVAWWQEHAETIQSGQMVVEYGESSAAAASPNQPAADGSPSRQGFGSEQRFGEPHH